MRRLPAHGEAAEAAHWPPWQAAAIRYLRERTDFNRSGGMGEGARRLAAFIFGVATHYATDELWEGLTPQLGRGQGMVRALSSFNLGHDGLSGDDEAVANMDADFHAPLGIGMGGIHPWKRDFPLDDAVAIYREYAGFPQVTRQSLANCRVLFDLGLWAEKSFGAMLFPVVAEMGAIPAFPPAPMVAERALELPLGGVDDAAVWASWVWERVARWMDEGPHRRRRRGGAVPSDRMRPTKPPTKRSTKRSTLTPTRGRGAAAAARRDGEGWAAQLVGALAPLQRDAHALMALDEADIDVALVDDADPSRGVVYLGSLHAADARVHALASTLEAFAAAVAGDDALAFFGARSSASARQRGVRPVASRATM